MIDTLSYAPDGGFHALLAPGEKPIDFGHVAQRLAGTLRFNGTQGALSVAQHAVTGAQAILSEGGDGLTAALFLHHDDHEFVLGDITSPVIAALEALNPGARAALQQLAGRWDAVLYAAAGLPAPDAWTQQQADAVRQMDLRMCAVEARLLFGLRATAHFSRALRRPPLFESVGAPCWPNAPAWPAGLAEERFAAMHKKLTGRTLR